jgi:hypothetical protein
LKEIEFNVRSRLQLVLRIISVCFLVSQVEIIETYCDPRDSKAYLEPGEEASAKLYTSPDKDYSQPYTTGEFL